MISLRISFTVICLLALLWVGVAPIVAQSNQDECVTFLGNHTDRIFRQPHGPFAVMAFYLSALGNYCGVIYYENDDVGDPHWNNYNRFWQDTSWASDVTGFCWTPDGKYLYVSTSGVYGEGGLYQLDLLNRRSELIFPKKSDSFYQIAKGNGCIVDIKGLDSKSLRLTFTARVLDVDSSDIVTRTIEVK